MSLFPLHSRTAPGSDEFYYFKRSTAEGVTIKSTTAIGAFAGFTHVPPRHFTPRVCETPILAVRYKLFNR